MQSNNTEEFCDDSKCGLCTKCLLIKANLEIESLKSENSYLSDLMGTMSLQLEELRSKTMLL